MCVFQGFTVLYTVFTGRYTNDHLATTYMTEWNHISDHDLERYYLGLVKNKTELAAMEEHILACGSCAERAAEAQDYVDALRGAALDLVDPYERPDKSRRAKLSPGMAKNSRASKAHKRRQEVIRHGT